MDNVLLNKAANLERCIQRIKEEYLGHESELEKNYTRQDAIVLNLLRACETAIDMGNYIIREKSLGLPQSSRDVFTILENAKIIPESLSRQLQAMVGFRNIAVHNYTALDIAVVRSIIQDHLEDLLVFSRILTSEK